MTPAEKRLKELTSRHPHALVDGAYWDEVERLQRQITEERRRQAAQPFDDAAERWRERQI